VLARKALGNARQLRHVGRFGKQQQRAIARCLKFPRQRPTIAWLDRSFHIPPAGTLAPLRRIVEADATLLVVHAAKRHPARGSRDVVAGIMHFAYRVTLPGVSLGRSIV
jgi:hypothetical protein